MPAVSRLKTEALAHFQQKILQVVDDGLLQIGFAVFRFFGQVQEFQHVGIAEDIGGCQPFTAGMFTDDGGLVGAETGAFKEHAVHGALQVADRPVVADGLRFLEGALERAVGFQQFDNVGEAELIYQYVGISGQFTSH